MRSRQARLSTLFVYAALVVSVVFMTFPLLWILLVSFKTLDETFAFPIVWIPKAPTLQNYLKVWGVGGFTRYFINTVVVALVTTLLAMSVAAPAAYGFSRFKYRLGKTLPSFFLVTQMFPAILLVIPYFVMMRSAGLINTYPALFLIFSALALPFCTWMLIGFFEGISRELDEAAMVDGCNRFQAFLLIILPLSAPGLVATALFAFVLATKEYLFPLALTSEKSMYMLVQGIAALFTDVRVPWNEVMAAAMIATVPALVFYAFLERHLIRGLTSGAVKG